jgi:hypothetical protein
VIHDTRRRGHDHKAKLTRRQQVVDPLFDFVQLDAEAGGNNASLVQAAVQLNDNLARAMIVNQLEFANVSCVAA